MSTTTYAECRHRIETYFDRTALDAWKQLTSDAPVNGIRATVRAGRERMRSILLSWLPGQLLGARVLDAGCGTGAFSFEVARRGAEVLAVDVSKQLVAVAKERMPAELDRRIDFRVADMLDPALGDIDHVIAMDSLIHYETRDIVHVLALLAPRTAGSILFTIAPRTPLLRLMHAAGRLFPRGNRAPAIVPADFHRLRRLIAAEPLLAQWRIARTERVICGFYMSQAVELTRK